MEFDEAVRRASALTSNEAAVALAWSQTSTDGKSNASFAQIAGISGVARGTAITATKSLVAKGWLEEVERVQFKPTVYRTRLP